MTREDLHRRFSTLKAQLEAGMIDVREYRLLRRGAALAYSLEQPARRAARRKIRTEVAARRMRKPEVCENENCHGTPVESHHDDYSQVLAVRWLCPRCHDAADRAQEGRLLARVAG